MTRLDRLEPLLLVIAPIVYAGWVFGPGIGFDPDAYYHIGVARLYASRGWLSSFPWLQFTILGEGFPNPYVVQHLLLAPLTAVFESVIALKAGVVLFSTALVFSFYKVLTRWTVPHAALWAVLGAFSSPVLINVNSTIKGGALFFVLLVWYLDAVWSESTQRTFALAWLSVSVYVGALILLLPPLVFMFVKAGWERTWQWRLPAAAAIGLVAGAIVNPFWPHQWIYAARELSTVFFIPSDVAIGEFFGSEWTSVPGRLLIQVAGLHLGVWGVLLVWQLSGGRRIDHAAAAGAVVALAFLGAAVMTAKFLPLFFITSVLFAPRLWIAMQWPGHWPARGLLAAGATAAALNLVQSYRDVHYHPNRPDPREYRAAADQVRSMTPAGQVVLAPWDDFPGLFLFNTHNTYVAGMNPLFLRWVSERRFLAYSYLYQGRVSDPENLLPTFFEDARIVLARAKPRTSGERSLLQRLSSSPHFEEIRSASPTWRIFRLGPAG
jgi:hypothetical protein